MMAISIDLWSSVCNRNSSSDGVNLHQRFGKVNKQLAALIKHKAEKKANGLQDYSRRTRHDPPRADCPSQSVLSKCFKLINRIPSHYLI